MTMPSARDRILVALDVASLDAALSLVRELSPHVGGFKVGLELTTSVGVGPVVTAVSQAGGNVFLDLKFKDIPNTVSGAARAAARDGVFMFNVHCDGGLTMMRAAKEAALASGRQCLVIGVTVLTSIDEHVLRDELGVQRGMEAQVVHLARLARSAGLDGVVSSAREVQAIKEACGADFLTVVPGLRPSWSAAGDQKRTLTPGEAVLAGADYLVIGRPITSPPAEIGSPADAARRVAEEIEAGMPVK
jgi:orotidine-5'-phosphate decarboxylase